MKHYVDVPVEQHLFFPPFCPYTGSSPADSTITVVRTTNGMIIPIPFFGFLQSYSQSFFEIPVNARVSALAARLRLLSWTCLLGGITGVMLALMQKAPFLRGHEASLLFGGILLSCVLSLTRWWKIRRVCIVRSWNNFQQVRFHNQEYAQQFSQMNRLFCESR